MSTGHTHVLSSITQDLVRLQWLPLLSRLQLQTFLCQAQACRLKDPTLATPVTKQEMKAAVNQMTMVEEELMGEWQLPWSSSSCFWLVLVWLWLVSCSCCICAGGTSLWQAASRVEETDCLPLVSGLLPVLFVFNIIVYWTHLLHHVARGDDLSNKSTHTVHGHC